MAAAGVPSLLQLAWQSVWGQIQADINANAANWNVSRRNRTLVRNPVLNLNIPFRVVVRCLGLGGAAPAAPPAADNNGLQVLSATIAAAALPVGVLIALGAPQANWNDIDGQIVP